MGRRIARVSTTPGKTRALNVYQIDLGRGEWSVVPDDARRSSPPHRHDPRTTRHAFYLLDLPGYGYARASKADRAAFGPLVRHAVGRPRLAGVVWLLDIRREPSDDDRAMQDLFAAAATNVLAAVTKSDKLPHGRRLAQARALVASLGLDAEQVVVTSARTGDGIPDLRQAVAGLLEGTKR